MAVIIPGAYRSPYDDDIARLMLRRGDVAARGAEASGQIWGNTVKDLGGLAADTIGKIQAKKQEEAIKKQRETAFNDALQTWTPEDPQGSVNRLASVVGPEEAIKFSTGLMSFQSMMEKNKRAELASPQEIQASLSGAAIFWKHAPDSFNQAYPMLRETLGPAIKARFNYDLPETPTPEIQQSLAELAGVGQKPAGQVVDTIGPDGKPMKRLVSPDELAKGVPMVGKEPPRHVITVPGPNGQPMARLVSEDELAQGVATYKAPPTTVIANQSDVKETVAGMVDGTLPPQLPGRATKEYNAIMAEAHRQGYDLAKAATDWVATQKHIATLNGSQQTRLRQAVDTASHSLDVIEDLAEQWKGGKFPMLNRAQLSAAKNGVLGARAQSIATQLEAQISDVTSELGNVYMGGNSPTDHALQLAAKNLSADWSMPQLKAALELSRKNLHIRANSMNNVGVAGASEDNPYGGGRPAGSPSKRYKFNPATGELE